MSEPKTQATPTMETVLKQMIPGVYLVGCGVLLTYVLAMILFRNGISKDPGDWGSLGDYFGGLMNPVISFATLMVAYAVWKQQKEELKATKEALQEQATTSEQQRQEQRFFDLLNTYYRTVESLRFDKQSTDGHGPESYFGKEAIREWLSSHIGFNGFLRNKGTYVVSADPVSTREANIAQLTQLAIEWGGSSEVYDRFGPYLRTIDKILATANLVLSTHKLEYLHLFRAQLSNSELALIGYQLLLGQEGSDLQKNAEQFGLLSTLSHGDLRSALLDQLSAGAFIYFIEKPQGDTSC